MEKEIEMFYNEDYARVNADYRREMLSRSWTHGGWIGQAVAQDGLRGHAKDKGPRRFLPHLPSVSRARRTD